MAIGIRIATKIGPAAATMLFGVALKLLVEGARRPSRRQMGFIQLMITSGVANHGVGRMDLRISWTRKQPKYVGNTTKWYGWAESFRRYLRRHDSLWPEILTKIEKMEGRVISKEDENALQKEY